MSFWRAGESCVGSRAPVTWDLEITEICDRVTKSGGPALLFENVEGYDVPVLINMYGSERRMAWALGSESLEELGDRVRGLLGLVEGPPKGVMEKVRALGSAYEGGVGSSESREERAVPGGGAGGGRGGRDAVSDFEVLAGGRGEVYHAAAGHHEGPGVGEPERGDVPDAGVRRADLRDALADAEGGDGALSSFEGAGSGPDGRGGGFGGRPGDHLERDGAASSERRRDDGGGVHTGRGGGDGAGEDGGPGGAGAGGDYSGGVRDAGGRADGGAIRGPHGILFAGGHVSGISHNVHNASSGRDSIRRRLWEGRPWRTTSWGK